MDLENSTEDEHGSHDCVDDVADVLMAFSKIASVDVFEVSMSIHFIAGLFPGLLCFDLSVCNKDGENVGDDGCCGVSIKENLSVALRVFHQHHHKSN